MGPALLALCLTARAADLPDSEGVRIEQVGGGSGVYVGEALLVGPDGGVQATTVSARAAVGELFLAVEVPYVAYRAPDGRDGGLGNIRIRGSQALPSVASGRVTLTHALGVQLHFAPFDSAWTWIDAADDIWPGAGLDAFWEGRLALGDGDRPRTLLLRGAVGFHNAAGYAPFPDRYVRGQAAVGLDQPIGSMFGVVGELSVQGWDPSPLELSVLGRIEALDVLRARAGVVLPIAGWAGIAPNGLDAGLREATLVVDVGLHL